MDITKENIIQFLKSKKEFLNKEFGITSISLFGSYARDEATEESDIDLFVEFDSVDFNKLSGLYIYLEDTFKKKISLVHKHDRIKEKFLKIISRDLIHVA